MKLRSTTGGEASPWGIDVSHWNEIVDWTKVKQAGVEFIFIKASEGVGFKDPNFALNWRRAKEHGILRGAYHYFKPRARLEGQIDNFVSVIGAAQTGDLPPVLDVEDPPQWRGISKRRAADLCISFLEGVRRRLGERVHPILYASSFFPGDVLGADLRLASYKNWTADYSSPFPDRPRVAAPWQTWEFWQFTDKGAVAGIKGDVDVNRFNGDRARLHSLLIE